MVDKKVSFFVEAYYPVSLQAMQIADHSYVVSNKCVLLTNSYVVSNKCVLVKTGKLPAH